MLANKDIKECQIKSQRMLIHHGVIIFGQI